MYFRPKNPVFWHHSFQRKPSMLVAQVKPRNENSLVSAPCSIYSTTELTISLDSVSELLFMQLMLFCCFLMAGIVLHRTGSGSPSFLLSLRPACKKTPACVSQVLNSNRVKPWVFPWRGFQIHMCSSWVRFAPRLSDMSIYAMQDSFLARVSFEPFEASSPPFV